MSLVLYYDGTSQTSPTRHYHTSHGLGEVSPLLLSPPAPVSVSPEDWTESPGSKKVLLSSFLLVRSVSLTVCLRTGSDRTGLLMFVGSHWTLPPSLSPRPSVLARGVSTDYYQISHYSLVVTREVLLLTPGLSYHQLSYDDSQIGGRTTFSFLSACIQIICKMTIFRLQSFNARSGIKSYTGVSCNDIEW